MRGFRTLLLTGALVACGSLAALAFAAEPAAPGAWVNEKTLANADKHPGEWAGPGRDFGEQRFSPLKQINTANAGQLGLAWYAELNSTRGLETTPIMMDGVLFSTQPWNITKAYDAKTGKLLWTYDPKVPEKWGRLACCDIVTRGLAAWKGKIYIAALDGRLIAVDAKTGKEIWSANTFDSGASWPMVMTGAPRVFDGKVLIGNSGGEAGGRGYITAYDAETGKRDWRFFITPGDPKGPKDANQAKADKVSAPTWGGEWWKSGGGGNDWDAIIYDPKSKLVYLSTGNAGPWIGAYRGGLKDNLFTSSIVALHVETGDYAWHYQEVPGEEWDYDATAPLMTADLKIKGRLRHVIMHAPKNGFFYVLDRITGKVISAKAYVPQNWTKGLDKNWRPIIDPAARYGVKPIMVYPGAAHNWQPMAFNPGTGLIYFPVNVSGRIIALDPDFKLKAGEMSQLGTALVGYEDERKRLSAEAKKINTSFLIAYDPVKQKEAWRVPYATAGNGGVLTTAGNLVFEGVNNATFAAYDARTGAKVWDMPVQQVPIAAPMSYEVDGEQYVAVQAGYGGGTVHDASRGGDADLYDYGRLLVFKLGGTAQLPKFTPRVATLDPPPQIARSNGEMKAGYDLYNANCVGCHGENARGGVKDLRKMSKQTHAEFFDIVLGGKRSANGMASFSDKLSHQDVELIQKYLIGRIVEDWADLKNGR